MFTTPKHDGSVRVIFNLKLLNEFVETHNFKMDMVKETIIRMRLQCYFALIDFKHAFYSVIIAMED